MTHHRPDVVVLAAATVGGIEANRSRPADFLLQNLKIETQVMKLHGVLEHGDCFFGEQLHIYPKLLNSRFERKHCLLALWSPLMPGMQSPKSLVSNSAKALRLQHGFDAISVMPTNLYGPGDNYHPRGSHVLPALIRRFMRPKACGTESVCCWGTGKPLREFLHADDLGEACVLLLEKNWSILNDDSPGTMKAKN